jgi:hypothetical protein
MKNTHVLRLAVFIVAFTTNQMAVAADCQEDLFNSYFDKLELESHLVETPVKADILSWYLYKPTSIAIPANTNVNTFNVYKFLLNLQACRAEIGGVTNKELITLIKNIQGVLPSLDKNIASSTGKYTAHQVRVLEYLSEDTLIELLKHWEDKADALSDISYDDALLLISNLDEDKKKAFLNENELNIEEAAKNKKVREEIDRKFKIDEINNLTDLMFRVGLNTDQNARFDKIKAELGTKETHVNLDLPLTAFNNYPTVLTRFFYGGEAITDSRASAKIYPNLGIYHYRQGTNFSFINTAGFTSTKRKSEDEKNEDVAYNLIADQLVYWTPNEWKLQVGEGSTLYHGLIGGVALNVYEEEKSSSDAKFIFRPDLNFGYRAAYSPERYSEFTVRQCWDIENDFDFKCYPRVKAEMKLVTPTFSEDTKVQFGIGFELKTNKNDVFANAVILNFRFHSSFNDIYKNVLVTN